MLPPPTSDILNPGLLAGARVIVLIVLDGYGWRSQGGRRPLLDDVDAPARAQAHLTSVFPATTAAALTSLQTGVAPATHGLAGYTLYLPALGRVMNMIQLKPADGGELPAGAVDPTTLLPVPTLYDILRAGGVDCEVVSHREYARSPLTIVHSGATPYTGHRTPAEFATCLRAAVLKPGRRFVFGYWAGIDMLAHSYGPTSEACRIEADLIERALIDGLLATLPEQGDDACVLVTADHGLVTVPESEAAPMYAVAGGIDLLRSPTGERRAAGLMLGGPAQRARLAEWVGARGLVLDTREAAEAGLFGPPPLHAELLERVGDSLLLAVGGASFPFRITREGDVYALGAHGSVTAEEMLVPLYVWRYRR
jgi:hypothetical protein